MSADEQNEQQISPVAGEDHISTQTPVAGASKPPPCKSTTFSFNGSADAAKERKQIAYKRMKEMEK